MILGREPKNQVIWTTCCKVMVKYIFQYISIDFMKSYVPLVSYKLDVNIFVEDLQFALSYAWPLGGIGGNAGTTSIKGFFQTT